jgi:uncharacterized protein involved in outer membrane biogenesis
MNKKRWALAIVLVVLVGTRLALPAIVKSQINKKLAGLENYQGRVKKVHLALWRGAIALESLELRDKAGLLGISLPRLEVYFDWAPLLHRMLVADVELDRPALTMVLVSQTPEEKAEKAQAAEPSKPLNETLAELLPFRIDRFRLRNGTVRVRDQKSDQETKVSDIQFKVANLTNAPSKSAKGAYAHAVASAKVMDTGKAELKVDVDPTAAAPAFNLSADLKDLDLTAVNPMLRSQYGIDVHRGKFEMFSEASAAEGKFKGYVKPFIEDLKMLGPGDAKKPGKAVKKAAVGAVAAMLKNKDGKAVATKVPISGSFDDPKIGVWPAVGAVLKNAFIESLKPRFE